MGSILTKDVFPFLVVCGNPAKFLRINTHPLKGYRWEEDKNANLCLFQSYLSEKEEGILKEVISFHEVCGQRGKRVIMPEWGEEWCVKGKLERS